MTDIRIIRSQGSDQSEEPYNRNNMIIGEKQRLGHDWIQLINIKVEQKTLILVVGRSFPYKKMKSEKY